MRGVDFCVEMGSAPQRLTGEGETELRVLSSAGEFSAFRGFLMAWIPRFALKWTVMSIIRYGELPHCSCCLQEVRKVAIEELKRQVQANDLYDSFC